MHQPIISTLPITPKFNAAVGNYFTPFVGDVLSRYLKIPFWLALNLTGMRAERQNLEHLVVDYTKYLRHLDINPTVWHDRQEDYQKYVTEVVNLLYNNGKITVNNVKIYACPCGIVEIPKNRFDSRSGDGKLFHLEDNDLVRCNVCQEVAELLDCDSLVLHFPEQFDHEINIIGKHHENDFQDMLTAITGVQHRISRQRTTYFMTNIENKIYYLDVDFSWALMVNYLYSLGYDVRYLVSGSKTLSAVARTVLINKLVDIWESENLTILVTPYLAYKGGEEKYHIKHLVERYEPTTLRLWLSERLYWSQKECVLDTKRIYWVMRSLDKISGFSNKYEDHRQNQLNLFSDIIEGNNIQLDLQQAQKSETTVMLDKIIHQCMFSETLPSLPDSTLNELSEMAAKLLRETDNLLSVFASRVHNKINIILLFSEVISFETRDDISTKFTEMYNIHFLEIYSDEYLFSKDFFDHLGLTSKWYYLGGDNFFDINSNHKDIWRLYVARNVQHFLKNRKISKFDSRTEMFEYTWKIMHLMLLMSGGIGETAKSSFVAFQMRFDLINSTHIILIRRCLEWIENHGLFDIDNQDGEKALFMQFEALWQDLLKIVIKFEQSIL